MPPFLFPAGRFRAASALVCLLLLFVGGAPVVAQDPPDDKETFEDPWPEDKGSTEDPWADDSESTLGLEVEPYSGDLLLLDDPSQYSADKLGAEPSAGYGEELGAAAMQCTNAGDTVTPIGVSLESPRYLSYSGTPRVLIGTSADAACHFLPTTAEPLKDSCNAGTGAGDYRKLFPELRTAGLRKIRLWVSLLSKDEANTPFLKEAPPGSTVKKWMLHKKNQPYFNRLREVVSLAKAKDLFVEVTFFAPFQGAFETSVWSYAAGQTLAPIDSSQPGSPLTPAGFTDPWFFVVKDPRFGKPGTAGVEGAKNERMREYQKKIIEWTVKELWCYDNVIWEVANEPEDQTVNPDFVTAWQKDMITTVGQFDCRGPLSTDCLDPHSRLTRPHLIAVQPFTKTGGDNFLGFPQVAIINSHYTHVQTDDVVTNPNPPGTPRGLNFGMIQMTHQFGNAAKVLGFNEMKITPLGGTAGPRRHLNGAVDTASSLDASRAEAWEFLFNLGGMLDHWGYLSKNGLASPVVAAMRQQLSKMQTFMNALPLTRLKTAATVPGSPPAWITGGLNTYPTGAGSWNEETKSQRYWASLQTDMNAASGRLFLLYSHNSTRRCWKDQRDFTAAACASSGPNDPNPDTRYMSQGGYDARVWTPASGKRYTASFNVNLGPNQGMFDVVWLRPSDLQPLKQQPLAWRKSTCSEPGCIVCPGPASACTVAFTEGYDFDVLLKITQRP